MKATSFYYLLTGRTGLRLALLALLGLLASCSRPAKEPDYRIGFSQCTMGDDWRRAMVAGMEKELGPHPNVHLTVLDAHNDSNLQGRQIALLIRQRVDMLIISPTLSGPLTPLTEAAYNAGIPVIILDRRTSSRQYTAFVGGDNLEVGRAAARHAALLLHQRGQVLEIEGMPGSSPATDRSRGFAEALPQFPNLKLAARLPGDWQPGSVLRQLPALLRAHPDVDLIFAHNDPMARAAYQVVRDLNLSRRIRIIGVDGLPGPGNGLQLVEDGTISATLLYPTGGEEAIRTALRILRHEPFDKENVLGTMIIDSTNVEAVRTQAEQLIDQQYDLRRQQQQLDSQLHRYSNQRTLVYLLLASLLITMLLGGLTWRSLRLNRRIRRTLETQNAEISAQRNQISRLAEKAREAAEETRRSSEAKLRFFTNFSHELRTPLSLILGPVEDLLTALLRQ